MSEYLKHWNAEVDSRLLSVTTQLDDILKSYRLCIRCSREGNGFLYYLSAVSGGSVWSPPGESLPPITIPQQMPVWIRQVVISSTTALALYQILTRPQTSSALQFLSSEMVKEDESTKLVSNVRNGILSERAQYSTTYT